MFTKYYYYCCKDTKIKSYCQINCYGRLQLSMLLIIDLCNMLIAIIVGDFTQIVWNRNKYCIFASLKSRLIIILILMK